LREIDTARNPKSRGGLLPSHGREQCGGFGEGGGAAGGDSESGSPSNLPQVARSLFVSLFSISVSVIHKKEYLKVYIDDLRSKQI
jgi:hypothetical protein